MTRTHGDLFTFSMSNRETTDTDAQMLSDALEDISISWSDKKDVSREGSIRYDTNNSVTVKYDKTAVANPARFSTIKDTATIILGRDDVDDDLLQAREVRSSVSSHLGRDGNKVSVSSIMTGSITTPTHNITISNDVLTEEPVRENSESRYTILRLGGKRKRGIW